MFVTDNILQTFHISVNSCCWDIRNKISDWTTDMTSRGSSCFWLTKFKENASGIVVLLKISNLFQNGCHCRQSFYITPYGLSPLLCYHWMLALMFIVWLFTIGNIVGFFFLLFTVILIIYSWQGHSHVTQNGVSPVY